MINSLIKECGIDIRVIRRTFSGSLGKMNILPVPLGIDRVFIPVKIRKPIRTNNGAYGYKDLSYIKEVAIGKMVLIKLKCD